MRDGVVAGVDGTGRAPQVCARVLARLFPNTPAELADLDPWTVLLWATGRLDLPGHPRPEKWRWRGAPLEDNDEYRQPASQPASRSGTQITQTTT